jgi:hypothetical protein
MRHSLHALLLVVVTVQASAQSKPSSAQTSPAPSAPAIRRFTADSLWRRVWLVGADSTSDRFVEPRQISATGDVVVVLDEGTREVHGLDARTGATRFLLKPRGQGPGEFKRPAMLAATPDGFVVLDHANARLTAYDRSARRQWDAVLDNIFIIDGLCVRTGPRVVAKLKRRDSAIVEYDTTGRRTAVRSFPWKQVPPNDVGFAYSAFTSDASPTGTCVTAPIFGGEWGVAPPSGPLRTFALKEPGAPAVITVTQRILDRTWNRVTVEGTQQSETKHASRGAMTRGDTAIVYAAHTKQYPLTLLDYYDARTGAYLHSRKLPFTFNAITVGPDGTFYGTRISNTQQAIVALRAERSGGG